MFRLVISTEWLSLSTAIILEGNNLASAIASIPVPHPTSIIVDGLICATLGRGPENLKERFPEVDALWGTGFWN